MRDWLRRRLNETTPDQWTNADLNTYLNEGLRFMQQTIESIDNEAFVYIDTTPCIADQQAYAWPTNMKREMQVEIKYNTSQTDYTILVRRGYRRVKSPDGGWVDLWSGEGVSAQANTYAHRGRYLYLQTAPTENVTAGIRLTYVPILSMGADSDVPDLPIDLHMGVVLKAQLVAFGDASGAIDKESVTKELGEILALLPTHYDKTGGEPNHFEVSSHVKFDIGDY